MHLSNKTHSEEEIKRVLDDPNVVINSLSIELPNQNKTGEVNEEGFKNDKHLDLLWRTARESNASFA